MQKQERNKLLSINNKPLEHFRAIGLWSDGQPLRLHLGCGEQHFDGYINIDYPPSEHNVMQVKADIFANITELDFPPSSVDEIRLHHVFEHFDRATALAMLIKWHQWLKIGGKLHIETPDFVGNAKTVLANSSWAVKMGVIRHISGSHEASWAYHVDQWFAERFEHTLNKLGFDHIQIQHIAWQLEPFLSNVHAIALKSRELALNELLQAADELLWESTVSPSEKPLHEVWKKQLREMLSNSGEMNLPSNTNKESSKIDRIFQSSHERKDSVGLIFSKDRALQLDATLRSFLSHCTDADTINLKVLYTTSNSLHQNQYQLLTKEYPTVDFIQENNFKENLLSIISPSKFVLFLVDDNIFVKQFSLADVMKSLEQYPGALGFSLRLGRNTTYCYMLNTNQSLPYFFNIGNNMLGHDWISPEYDFGYPLEVSSSVYRVEDILPLLASLQFKNPNTLEAMMDSNKALFQKSKPFLQCYEQSVTFCAPVNMVQSAWPNRASTKAEYSSDYLAKLFDEGVRIDVSAFNDFIPNACHQEVELQFIDKSGRRISSVLQEKKLVSILILNYNGLNDIRACLESIQRNTPENHEIIVVDNASTDGSLEYLRALPDITLIENPTNIGCPPARAEALSLAKGDYVILLDNDTIVTNGWITKFIAHAEADPAVGIMGPRSNYVSGNQIVPNVPYRTLREMDDFAARFAFQNRGQLTPTVRLVGFCMFIHREVINKIGNIDASFGKFGFEDDDYTWRANIAGFKTCIANDVFIHHTGGPQGRGDMQYNRQLIEAWEQYKRKWNLPENLPYATHCSPEILSGVFTQPFDPRKHYMPLTGRSTVEKLIFRQQQPEDKKDTEVISAQEAPEMPQEHHATDPVSIIMIAQQTVNVKKCLKNIQKHTPEPHDIILVPTDFSPKHLKLLRKSIKGIPNCTIVAEKDSDKSAGIAKSDAYREPADRKNIPFSKACNLGISHASNEYVIVMSDDIMVNNFWLTGMLEVMKKSDDIGIVGPMMTNIEGPQRIEIMDPRGQGAEDSSEIENKERFRPSRNDIGKDSDPAAFESSNPELIEQYALAFRKRNRYRCAPAKSLNSSCLLLKRGVYSQTGIFDESFLTPDFAVDDYCLRAMMKGYRNVIAGDVLIYHEGSKEDIPKNKVLFADKKHYMHKWMNPDEQGSEREKLFAVNAMNASHDMLQKGQKDKALSALVDGLRAAPHDERLHREIVSILLEQKRFQDADDVLKSLPDSMKQGATWLELAGYCREGMQAYDEAEMCANRLLEIDEKSTKAFNLKGMVAFKKGLHSEAESFFRKTIKAEPGFGEAYSNLGAMLWSQKNFESAFELLEKAFILSPTSEDIATNYHSAAVALSQTKRAITPFTEAASLHPLNKRLTYMFADLLIQQEQYHRAMDVLEDALHAFGIDDDTLALAGALREKIGPHEKGPRIRGSKDSSDKSQKMGSTTRTLEPLTPGTLSLCMIVKNEEKIIANCLKKIEPVADEMIVVDTGSTDRTREIAKVFGARVYDFPWNNSFSDARNHSLSKAMGDWIIILDADETISALDFDRLKKLVNTSGRAFAYSLYTRNYVLLMNTVGWVANDGTYLKEEAGSGWYQSKKVRLFPNDSRIRFEAPVHEYVEHSLLRAGLTMKDCDIPIHHYGKLDANKIMAKGEQYYELGKLKWTERGQHDPLAIYELAVQASELGKFEEALVYWERAVELMPDYSKAFYGLGNTYFRLDRFEDAYPVIKKAIHTVREDTEWRDAIILFAHTAVCLGKAEEGIEYLNQLLTKFPNDPKYPADPMSLVLLAVSYLSIGNEEKGLKLLQDLKDGNYDAALFLAEFSKTLIITQNFKIALRLLNAAVKSDMATSEISALIAECERRMEEANRDSIEIHRDSVETEQIIPPLPPLERGGAVFSSFLDEGKPGEVIEKEDFPVSPTLAKGGEWGFSEEGFRPSRNDKPVDNVSQPVSGGVVSQTPNLNVSQRASISLCMIAKDEEDNIERALMSVKPIVDEMIVVDTGSTDRTKDIAQGLGAKVYDFAWTDSFADARNFSISKATGDWILILDADEVISPDDHEALRKLIAKGPRSQGVKDSSESASEEGFRPDPRQSEDKSRNDKHLAPRTLESSDPASFDPGILEPSTPVTIAYSFTTRNYISEVSAGWHANDGMYHEEAGTGWFPSEKVRLFPNDNRIRFDNPVHELVETSLHNAHIAIKPSPVPIHHYGKLHHERLSAKREKYYELMQTKLAERGGDDEKALFEIAVLAAELRKYEEAIEYWKKLIQLNASSFPAYHGMGNAYFNIGDYGNAVSSYKQALEIVPDQKDSLIMLAICEICLGNAVSSISVLEKILLQDNAHPIALLTLAAAYLCAGRTVQGKNQILHLKSKHMDHTVYFSDLAKRLLPAGRFDYAVLLLESVREARPDDAEVIALIEECRSKMTEDSRTQGAKDSSEQKQDSGVQGSKDAKEKGSRIQGVKDSNEYDTTNSFMSKTPSLSFPLVGNLSDSSLEEGKKGACFKEGFRPSRNDNQLNQESPSPRTLEPLAPGTLSLCMIARNEEDNIERALMSVKPVVDEMIVVDTGSTDRTKDIAQGLGAKAYDFAWTDSFADARNFAISKATSDWILILDADEVISPADHDEIRKLIKQDSRVQEFKGSSETENEERFRPDPRQSEDKSRNDKHLAPRTLGSSDPASSDPRILESSAPAKVAYLLVTRNYITYANTAGWIANDGTYGKEEAGTGWFHGEKVRLFPNDRRIVFQNPVHERVEPALEKAGISIHRCNIAVHHYGMLDDETVRSKSEYYYQLGKKRLAEKRGNDVYAIYDLAIQAYQIGKYDEALEYLAQVVVLKPDFAKAFESMGNAYFTLRQYDKALIAYTRSLELDPSSQDALFMSAQCLIILGKAESCIRNLELFIAKDPTYEKAFLPLIAAYFISGLKAKGIECVGKLTRFRLGIESYLTEFGNILHSYGRVREAELLMDGVEDIKTHLV
jgi:glycosyltransferase involved in cell wall biosynthesis